MQYRPAGNTGIELSALGFGCMRLPKLPDDKKTIDVEASQRLGAGGVVVGVTYSHPASVYRGGARERCLGEFLESIDRSTVHVSTKNPIGQSWFPIPGDEPTGALYRRLLDEELERLRTDYIDFYVFHDQSLVTFRILAKAPGGPLAQALKAREEGLIRHIGLSSHDSPQNIQRILEMADGAIELLICQYNLLDRTNEPLIDYAHDKGVAVSIMGPVGGGRLQHPSEVFMKATGAASTAEAAIRFVLANPCVTTAMSGMNSLEQVEENTASASREEALSEAELRAIEELVQRNRELLDLYCTACGYCMPCPHGVDIPGNFAALNTLRVHGLVRLARRMHRRLGEGAAASCQECGTCAGKCPQHIDVATRLAEVAEAFAEE